MVNLWRVLYRYRELVGVLVAKQIKLRYRGSLLGFLWTLLNPLLLMLVYTLVFSVYLRIDMPSYPAFLFAGLLPWMWLSSSLQQGVTSILDSASLVTRSQFPTQVLPVVTLTANTVNFLFTLPLLLAFLVAFRVPLGRPLLMLPALVVLEYVLILGLVLIASAVNIYFRDLQHIIVHLLTVLLFLTPVFYPVSLVPEWLRPWTLLNPFAVLVCAFQDVLYFNRVPPALPLLALLVLAGVLVSIGAALFDRYQQAFAETL